MSEQTAGGIMNHVFFPVGGTMYCLWQHDDEAPLTFALVDVNANRIVYGGPAAEVPAQLAKLAASAN
jgi:hypothetical protein